MTRSTYRSASPYEPRYGFSRAVRVGDRIVVAGTAPIGPDGTTWAPGQPFEQAQRCFAVMGEALEALGGTLRDVVRTRMFLTDASYADAVGRAHAEAVGEAAPAATMVVVSGLIDPEWTVEMECEAIVEG